jgi:flagellar biosynthesis/type III secretory pathway protein FliH
MSYEPLTVTPEEEERVRQLSDFEFNERARQLSEYKFEADLQSRILTAYDDGYDEGLKKGIDECVKIGIVKGRNQVLDLMKQGYSAAEIRRQLAENCATL